MRKNFNNKFKVAAVVACCAAATLFSACGNDTKDNVETTAQQEAEQSTADEKSAETNSENKEEDSVEASENVETTTEATTKEVKTTKEAKTLPPMRDLYSKIANKAKLSDMYQLDGEDIVDYYGIDVTGSCEDYVFYQSEVSPGIDTVALFNCKDSSSTKSVKKRLENVLESQKQSTKDYAPEEYAKARKASVKVKGNLVYLIICKDINAAEKVINQY